MITMHSLFLCLDYLLLCLLLAFATPPRGGAPAVATPPVAPRVVLSDAPVVKGERKAFLDKCRSQLGTREKTGRNDGDVVKYLVAAGAEEGDPYCAAFIYWCGREALGKANPFPMSAWSPDFVRNPTWTRAKGGVALEPGDVAGIWFKSKGRIAHVIVIERRDGPDVVAIGANTSSKGAVGTESDREGDGVFRKIYDLDDLHSGRAWMN